MLQSIAQLLEGQPDLLLPGGLPLDNVPEAGDNALIAHVVDITLNSSVTTCAGSFELILRLLRHGCVLHEMNRQACFKHGVVSVIVAAFTTHINNAGWWG